MMPALTTPRCTVAFPSAALRRRSLLLGGAGLLTLPGCGLAADPPTAEGGEREIDTALGKVRVPRSPKRVVALDYFPGLTLVDVDLTPAGVIDYAAAGDVPKRYRSLKGDDARVIGQNGQPDLEAIKGVEPDLIISQTYPASIDKQADLYEQLGTMAPTVVFAADWQAEWTDKATAIADAAGRESEAAKLKGEVLDKVDELSKRYADVIESHTWAQVTVGDSGSWVLYPRRSSLGAIFGWLNLALLDEAIDMKEKGGKAYSLEDVDLLDAADVVVYPLGLDGETAPELRDLLDNNQWKSTRPAKNGNVFGLRHSLVSSYGWALDALAEFEKTVLTPLRDR